TARIGQSSSPASWAPPPIRFLRTEGQREVVMGPSASACRLQASREYFEALQLEAHIHSSKMNDHGLGRISLLPCDSPRRLVDGCRSCAWRQPADRLSAPGGHGSATEGEIVRQDPARLRDDTRSHGYLRDCGASGGRPERYRTQGLRQGLAIDRE